MFLHDLESSKTAQKKRVGRGPGSGNGKTCGKGHKGAKSRSGYKNKRGFEGGQTPLNRRLPKFGFTSPNKQISQLINLQTLEDNAAIESGVELDKAGLKNRGLIKKEDKPVKLLGNGQLTKQINIQVDTASKSAVEAVKNAGGEVVTLG